MTQPHKRVVMRMSLLQCSGLPWGDHIRSITVPFADAKGPTNARHMAASLYRGEDYFMQIDSHTTFIQVTHPLPIMLSGSKGFVVCPQVSKIVLALLQCTCLLQSLGSSKQIRKRNRTRGFRELDGSLCLGARHWRTSCVGSPKRKICVGELIKRGCSRAP